MLSCLRDPSKDKNDMNLSLSFIEKSGDSRPEWCVVIDLCNGVPSVAQTFPTRKKAMEFFFARTPAGAFRTK
jgi:hypothetical protein